MRDGDRIRINKVAQTIDLLLEDKEIAARLAAWTPPPDKATRGVLKKYAKLVSSAHYGAHTG